MPRMLHEGSPLTCDKTLDFSRVLSCVASEGFEPPKAEPADLQSDPFGRLGN